MKEIDAVITEKHLEAALAVPWSTTTCIVAQSLLPHLDEGDKLSACGAGCASTMKGLSLHYHGDPASKVMAQFDAYHRDGRNERLERIRAMLPVEFKLKIKSAADLEAEYAAQAESVPVAFGDEPKEDEQ
jgi:hypothetical protein